MTVAPTAQAWPILRDDLQIVPARPEDGHPGYVIYDPASHRFTRLPWHDIEAIRRWHLGDPHAIAASLARETTARPSVSDIEALRDFLIRARLARLPGWSQSASLLSEARSRKTGAIAWILHHYLFLSIPLFNPDRALRSLSARTRAIRGQHVLITIGVLALLALIRIGQDWDDFTRDLWGLWSWRSVPLVAGSILFAKIVHEFGHGITAVRLGCRVPSMGVALLVLCPVLWTNTTDAWRLTQTRARIAIDAAGMVAELLLGALAAWAWIILPDGAAREAALALCGSTWLLTLAVNLNPLMRFDGYYITSDLLRIENLQDRSFAFARWTLRRAIFGQQGDPAPGNLPQGRQIIAFAYAIGTWIYRFFLFTGIAVLVYRETFKILGIILMAVEIGCFVVLPIAREGQHWMQAFQYAKRRRRAAIIGTVALVAGIVIWPFPRAVRLPAYAQVQTQERIMSAEYGTIRAVATDGQHLHAGETVLALDGARVERDIRAGRAELAYWHERAMEAARASDDHATLKDTIEHYGNAVASLQKAERARDGLVVRAPFEGVLRDRPAELAQGLDLPRRTPLGVLVGLDGQRIVAYATQVQIAGIAAGQRARFIPQNGASPIDATISAISPAPIDDLDGRMLWNAGHGALHATIAQGHLRPDRVLYRIEAQAPLSVGVRGATMAMQVPGTLAIAALPPSYLALVWHHVIAVFWSEATF